MHSSFRLASTAKYALATLLLLSHIYVKAVVDVLFLYQEKLLWYSDFSKSRQLMWQAAGALKHNPAWLAKDLRVHLLGHVDFNLTRDKRLLGFYKYDLSRFKDVTSKFHSLYKHQSINPRDYEFWCYNRWHIFRKYVEMRKDIEMETIVVIDNDVLFFEDLRRFANITRQMANSSWITSLPPLFDVISVIPGAVSIWSVPGLQTFSDYLFDLYSNIDKLKTLIEKSGSLFSGRHGPRPEAVWIKNGFRRHISDMYMIHEFIEMDPSRRKRMIPQERYLDSELQCIVQDKFDSLQSVYFVNGVPYNSSIVEEASNRKYCLLHFQGPRKPFLGAVLEHQQNATTAVLKATP